MRLVAYLWYMSRFLLKQLLPCACMHLVAGNLLVVARLCFSLHFDKEISSSKALGAARASAAFTSARPSHEKINEINVD